MAERKYPRLKLDEYNKPVICSVCGGHMSFQGVGEYQCDKCGNLEYDAYGKVRLYIEQHPHNSRVADVEAGTGVPRKLIRQMLQDERIEVAPDSTVFLQCEICRRSIRSGKYCPECAMRVKQSEELKNAKNNHSSMMHGYGKHRGDETGAKRFTRET